MGLVALLVTVLLLGLAWFYFPSSSGGTPTTRVEEARETVEMAEDIKKAMQGRNDETTQYLND